MSAPGEAAGIVVQCGLGEFISNYDAAEAVASVRLVPSVFARGRDEAIRSSTGPQEHPLILPTHVGEIDRVALHPTALRRHSFGHVVDGEPDIVPPNPRDLDGPRRYIIGEGIVFVKLEPRCLKRCRITMDPCVSGVVIVPPISADLDGIPVNRLTVINRPMLINIIPLVCAGPGSAVNASKTSRRAEVHTLGPGRGVGRQHLDTDQQGVIGTERVGVPPWGTTGRLALERLDPELAEVLTKQRRQVVHETVPSRLPLDDFGTSASVPVLDLELAIQGGAGVSCRVRSLSALIVCCPTFLATL